MGKCVSIAKENNDELLKREDSLEPTGHHWLSDYDYDYIYSRVPRACVDVIIKQNGKLLLTFRNHPPNNSLWHIIGGRIQLFETIKDTALRVVNKETNITINPDKLILKECCEFLDEQMPKYNMHSVSYIFEYNLDDNISIDEITNKRKWFKYDEIPCDVIKQHSAVLKKLYVTPGNHV